MFRKYAVESDPGVVVMYRWYLLCSPWLTVCLHKIVKSDDWDLHNHDWDTASLVLSGRYLEYVGTENAPLIFERKAWKMWYRPATEFHRVHLLYGKPVWTLFLRLKYRGRAKEVGYKLNHDGSFVDADLYDMKKGRFFPAERPACLGQ